MPAIDIRELRPALIIGAVIGALFGLLTSGPLGASAVIAERSAQDGTCSRGVCESAVWLRTPVRFSSNHVR
jgi:hypothetical protein